MEDLAMNLRARWSIGVMIGVAGLHAGAQRSFAQEQDSRFDIGVRGVLQFSKGQPANDMIGEGLIARFRLRDNWHFGVAYDAATFDYETPNRALGIVSTTVVDGSNESSRISVLLERRYESDGDWDWFWLAGVGFASIDDVQNVAGTRVGGGTFNIATDADDEVHLFAGGGLRRALGQRWAFDTTFTVEHHTTDYELVDLVSGARGSIGSQSPYGIALGVSYRF
jgi:hypothetical protein